MSHPIAESKQESLFVEQAAKEAEETPVLTGEPEATKLLEEARSYIYYWPEEFQGFQSTLSLIEGSQEYKGKLNVISSRNYSLELDGYPEVKWVKYQIEEILAHRESPNISKMSSKTGAELGDWDGIYGRKVVLLGDRMKSYYRIKDKKIMQISRSYNLLTFLINIDQHQVCNGRFAATSYNAFYWSNDKNSLEKVETYYDNYQEVGNLFIPIERRYSICDSSGIKSRSIMLKEIELF